MHRYIPISFELLQFSYCFQQELILIPRVFSVLPPIIQFDNVITMEFYCSVILQKSYVIQIYNIIFKYINFIFKLI